MEATAGTTSTDMAHKIAQSDVRTVNLAEFMQMFPVTSRMSVGDDFCVIDLRYDKCLEMLVRPCRFDGFLMFFCISGHFRISINLAEFEVCENSLFIDFPGDIITVPEIDGTQKEQLHFMVMAMTREYMSGMKVNMPQLMSRGIALLRNPCLVLTGEEKAIAKKYLELASDILRSNLLYKRECITSLLSSLFYLDGGVIESRMNDAKAKAELAVADRSKVVFDRFISVVSEYHTQERGVAFYADKLCLTPKYLSRLVKSASGKSAPEWIDTYIILEAKNMLKYSDIPIKEIVNRLHFPNQSTFHKFFKAHTGLTPLRYRKM